MGSPCQKANNYKGVKTMTQQDYIIRNRNKKLKIGTGEIIGYYTVGQFCKMQHKKLQSFTLSDYEQYYYYCKRNGFAGFGTECQDNEKAFIKLRNIIDRIQELLIF